jgi:hypothetical protein
MDIQMDNGRSGTVKKSHFCPDKHCETFFTSNIEIFREDKPLQARVKGYKVVVCSYSIACGSVYYKNTIKGNTPRSLGKGTVAKYIFNICFEKRA